MAKEIEKKWQAHSIRDYQFFLQLAQNHGAQLSGLKKVKIKDQYIETPEKFFQNSHLACRIRLMNGHAELTLKSFSDPDPDPDQDIFIRLEKSIKLPPFTTKKAALTYCQNHFFKRIQPLFEILNHRLLHTLILPCGTRAEASYDQVEMHGREKKFRMREIELEFKSGDLDAFKVFFKQLTTLPLETSKSSKFEVAMKHLFEDSSVLNQDKLTELANEILKTNFENLTKKEAAVLSTLDSEAIHDMRVATRRLRAAMKTFKRIMPTSVKKIRAKLQKLFNVLGKQRDLHIFSQFIQKAFHGKSVFLPKLVREINQTQKKLILMLKSKFYDSLIASLEHLRTSTQRGGNDPILKLARKTIRKALNKVIELAPLIDSKTDEVTLHKLRIRIKKLRYTCEFFEPIFTKAICSLDPLIEKIKKIQDVLGEHQDAIAGMARLISYKSQFSAEDFIQIKKEYEIKINRTRRLFFKIWHDFWVGVGFHRSIPTTAIELIFS